MMDTPPVAVKKTLPSSLTTSSLTPCRRMGLCRPSSGSLKKSLHVRMLNTPVKNEGSVSREVNKSVISCDKKDTTLDCEERLKVPLTTSDILNKSAPQKVRRCLTVASQTPSALRLKRALVNNESEISSNTNDLKSGCVTAEKCINKSSIQEEKRRRLSNKLKLSCSKEIEERNQMKNCNSTTPSVSPEHFTDIDLDDKTQEVTSEMVQQLVLSVREKKKKLEQLKVQEAYEKKHNLDVLRTQTAKWKEAGREALRYSVSLAKQAGYSVTLKQLMIQHGFPPHLMGYNSEDDEFD